MLNMKSKATYCSWAQAELASMPFN